MSTSFETDLARLLRETADAVPVPDGADPEPAVLRRAGRIRRRRAGVAVAVSAAAVTVLVLATTLASGLPGRVADPATGPSGASARPCLTERQAQDVEWPPTTPAATGVWQVEAAATSTRVLHRGRVVATLDGFLGPSYDLRTTTDHLPLWTDSPRNGSEPSRLVVVDAAGGSRTLVEQEHFDINPLLSPDGDRIVYHDGVGSGPVNTLRVLDLATGREVATLPGQYGSDTTYQLAAWTRQGIVILGPGGLTTWQPGHEPKAREGVVTEAHDSAAVLREGTCYHVVDPFSLPVRPSADEAVVAEWAKEVATGGRLDAFGWVSGTPAQVLAAYFPAGQEFLGGQKVPADHRVLVAKAAGQFPGRGSPVRPAPDGSTSTPPGPTFFTLTVGFYDATAGRWLGGASLWAGAPDLGLGPAAGYGTADRAAMAARWDLRLIGTPEVRTP